jgi:cytochrome c553
MDWARILAYGRGMAAMMEVSVTLSDQDIETIAHYLAGKP